MTEPIGHPGRDGIEPTLGAAGTGFVGAGEPTLCLLTGREPVLSGRWEGWWEGRCIARLEDDRLTLDEKLAEADRLAEMGTDSARAYLQRLLRRRCPAAAPPGEAGFSCQEVCEFEFPNAPGGLAEALEHREIWFDGQRLLEHKSDAVRRLESALLRAVEASRARSRVAC